jgi:hypothetical protein
MGNNGALARTTRRLGPARLHVRTINAQDAKRLKINHDHLPKRKTLF